MAGSDETGFEDKRRFPRLSILYLISYVSKEGGVQQTPISMGRVLDISPGGVRVEVFEEVDEGAEMELTITIGETSVAARGKVVRVEPAEKTKRILGIQFSGVVEELKGLRQGR